VVNQKRWVRLRKVESKKRGRKYRVRALSGNTKLIRVWEKKVHNKEGGSNRKREDSGGPRPVRTKGRGRGHEVFETNLLAKRKRRDAREGEKVRNKELLPQE